MSQKVEKGGWALGRVRVRAVATVEEMVLELDQECPGSMVVILVEEREWEWYQM
jgi:hypothetical protein